MLTCTCHVLREREDPHKGFYVQMQNTVQSFLWATIILSKDKLKSEQCKFCLFGYRTPEKPSWELQRKIEYRSNFKAKLINWTNQVGYLDFCTTFLEGKKSFRCPKECFKTEIDVFEIGNMPENKKVTNKFHDRNIHSSCQKAKFMVLIQWKFLSFSYLTLVRASHCFQNNWVWFAKRWNIERLQTTFLIREKHQARLSVISGEKINYVLKIDQKYSFLATFQE